MSGSRLLIPLSVQFESITYLSVLYYILSLKQQRRRRLRKQKYIIQKLLLMKQVLEYIRLKKGRFTNRPHGIFLLTENKCVKRLDKKSEYIALH